VFVIGDVARLEAPGRAPLPGVAPVAKQQGRYVARVIAARLAGRRAPPPFAYRNYGDLATIGAKRSSISAGCAFPAAPPGSSGASPTSIS
jgi:NADH dehydrogenase